jgi:RimJ/RimL family protein N-acetyltransferase
MIRSIPNINTSRVTLRAMRPEDFDRYAEIWAMPHALRTISGAPRDRRRAWETFLRNAGHWQMAGFGHWAVVDQRQREMIGHLGFLYGSTPVDEEFDTFPEVGWLMVPEARGSGVALDAAQAAHDWLDRVIPNKLVARISADNPVGRHIAEHLGYRELRQIEMTHDGTPQQVALMRRDGPSGHV